MPRTAGAPGQPGAAARRSRSGVLEARHLIGRGHDAREARTLDVGDLLKIVHRAAVATTDANVAMLSHAMTEKSFLCSRCTPGRSEQMLKTPWREGTIHIVMSPLEFMQRLAALVPRPRLHLIRFRGVLAAESQATGDCHPPTGGELQVSPMLLTFRMPRANGGSWPRAGFPYGCRKLNLAGRAHAA